ncbi:hypothetical protein LWI29_025779 [Acer saccharum]|uniref:Uncharacterized protein n=1 Tax=Acer saccharum TaxID=4024 RepID=A0AA39T6C2_ACESA|nr:hypothetical protein LWI29_025779 [Acer saccharum]
MDLVGPKVPSKPKNVSFSISSVGPRCSQEPLAIEKVDLCVDLGQVDVSPKEDLSKGNLIVIEKGEIVSSDNQIMKEEMVRATIAEEEKRDVEVVVADSEEEQRRQSMEVENPLVEARDRSLQGSRFRGRSRTRAATKHGMRTRQAVSQQNGQELASLADIEATRVVDTGRVLGFDFSKEEEAVMEEISRREKEDFEKFNVMSDCAPVNFEWLVEEPDLNLESMPEITSDSSEDEEGHREKVDDRRTKQCFEEWVTASSRKGVREETKNGLSRQSVDGRGGATKDKGKLIQVRNSNRKPTRGTYLTGKLILDKKRGLDGRGMGESVWSTSSDTGSKEGQIKEFGLSRDQEGRTVSLPLREPIQLPIKDARGGNIRGEDLVAVPLAVELGGGSEEAANQRRVPIVWWSLEEEIAKEKIKVKFCSQLFELSIVEEKAQVDRGWIRNFLGLRYGDLDSNSNSSSESERNGNPSEKVGARVPECQPITATSDKSHSYGMGCHNLKTYRTEGGKAFHNSRLGSKEEAKRAAGSFPFQTKERYFESASAVREAREKGKKVWQKKHKVRKAAPRCCNTAVILEKQRMVVSSEEESGSSSSKSSRRIRYPLGECSKKVHSKEGMRPGMNRAIERPIGLPIISMDTNEEDSSFSEESVHDVNGTMVPESDLDPIVKGPNNFESVRHSTLDLVRRTDLMGPDPQMEERQCRVTQDNRFEPIHLEVDLGVVNCMEGTRVTKCGQFPHTKK